jgi:hypothetical protein
VYLAPNYQPLDGSEQDRRQELLRLRVAQRHLVAGSVSHGQAVLGALLSKERRPMYLAPNYQPPKVSSISLRLFIMQVKIGVSRSV